MEVLQGEEEGPAAQETQAGGTEQSRKPREWSCALLCP